MSLFSVPDEIVATLKDKVVVLTGGANGIGAATVTRLTSLGSHVVFGDVNESAGTNLSASLSKAPGSVAFVQCDVTSYTDLYNLFRQAYDRFGHIDHAISNAGIIEQGKWFDPELTIESVGKQQETTQVLDVNLVGTANFARIAVVFLRESLKQGKAHSPSLTLLASVAAMRESPGLYMYQASKHGVLGLMRSMRRPIFERDGVRVNAVCPGFTKTEMTKNVFEILRGKGLGTQTADDPAQILVGIMARDDVNGKGIYVEGGKGWEFEVGIWDTMPQWLGEEPAKVCKANAEFVSSGALSRALAESKE